ncbi:MAG: hypothetical protein ACOCU6_02225 [Nanoarchaeota archaeon]
MSSYIQLDKVLEKDHTQVGLKAIILSRIHESARIPFSLVLTSNIFDSFIEHNGLEDIVSRFTDAEFKRDDTKIALFEEIVVRWKSSSFPEHIKEELRECFELLSIDTSNLKSLSASSSSTIITLQRSVSYHDTDSITDKLFFVKDDFDAFIDMIKTSMVGVFSPSSQKIRETQGIGRFYQAIILSTLPQLHSCFESFINPASSRMLVESYIGFFDQSRSVQRDSFILGVEFLKIVDTKIRSQNKVAIFDKEQNRISYQHYISTGSSQSAPEQIILECGRLSKKIMLASGAPIRAVFVSGPDNNLFCIGMQSVKKNIVGDTEQSVRKESLSSEVSADVTVEQTAPLQGLDTFVPALISFLEKNKQSKFNPTIKVLVRSLENDPSTETIEQALLTIKQMLYSFE